MLCGRKWPLTVLTNGCRSQLPLISCSIKLTQIISVKFYSSEVPSPTTSPTTPASTATTMMLHRGTNLGEDQEVDTTDVLIIGGGPSGLATAIKLKQLQLEKGKEIRVILLEKGSDIGKSLFSYNYTFIIHYL